MFAVEKHKWLRMYANDFRRRFINLLAFEFCTFRVDLVLSVMQMRLPKSSTGSSMNLDVFLSTLHSFLDTMTRAQLLEHVSDYDLARLQLYTQNLVDHHLVTDLLPPLARLFYTCGACAD